MAVSSSGAASPSFPTPTSQGAVDAMPGLMNDCDTQQGALKHDPGISLEWSGSEQSILDDALVKFSGETPINKYIKIAALLSYKTVRDVALRCRWILMKESDKRRKADEQCAPRKSRDKKPLDSKSGIPTSLHVAAAPLCPAPMLPMESDDGIPDGAIEGTAGQLLEQNSEFISQIKANLAACKIQENTDLLAQFRDNIFALQNTIREMPGIINDMPQLPVRPNTDLIEALLPKRSSSLLPS